MSLDDVVIIMSIPRRLVLAIRQRRGGRGNNSPGPSLSRPEQKPPPVVVIKRDLRDEDIDDMDRVPRSRSSRERRTGAYLLMQSNAIYCFLITKIFR